MNINYDNWLLPPDDEPACAMCDSEDGCIFCNVEYEPEDV